MQFTDLSRDYFALFGLAADFELDKAALAERYRELQRNVHPDRFANAGDAERRLSMQMAARVNEGYRVLKDPLMRARYLLELAGLPVDDSQSSLDGQFLMQQMELRERLDAARRATDAEQRLQALAKDLALAEQGLIDELAGLFADGSPDALTKAREASRKLQFYRRLAEELLQFEEELSLS